jgi:translation initiation factor RLI1
MLRSDEIQRISVLGIYSLSQGAKSSINKLNSQKDKEQKASGNFFFLET